MHIPSTTWKGGAERLGPTLIEKTAPFGFDVGPDGSKVGELLGQLRWLASLGIETVFGWVVAVDQITPLEIMGRQVIPAVAEL